MDIKTRGATNALYNAYGDEILQRSTSTQRTCVIEQVYEVLPQDNKSQERNKLEKVDTFKAKNSLSLHYSRVHQMVHFMLSFWPIWALLYLG